MNRRASNSLLATRALCVLAVTTLLLMTAYIVVRMTTLFATGYSIADVTMAVLLLGAELFLVFHGTGYFLSVLKVGRRRETASPVAFCEYGPASVKPVAVLVAAFNESEEVLEETLASVCAMDYPAAHVYLLDDSTRAECREGAARMAAKYRARLVQRTDRPGYKAGAINDLIPHLSEPFIALLDADQRLLASLLKELVPALRRDPG